MIYLIDNVGHHSKKCGQIGCGPPNHSRCSLVPRSSPLVWALWGILQVPVVRTVKGYPQKDTLVLKLEDMHELTKNESVEEKEELSCELGSSCFLGSIFEVFVLGSTTHFSDGEIPPFEWGSWKFTGLCIWMFGRNSLCHFGKGFGPISLFQIFFFWALLGH